VLAIRTTQAENDGTIRVLPDPDLTHVIQQLASR
jgi:hypothetical protein